jgi:hypothetical protein
MSAADKLKAAPPVETAPADVVASFLPKGTDAASVTWGEKTLTYWERVVAYHGQVGGQEVTLYFDLESGQWAKKYESFESLSQIPAGQVPDVMVLGLGGDLGDRLIRNKLQYDYDWISQPPAMTADGKQIFRDEKGYPKAVFDPAAKKWLTPEAADVVWTWDKWGKILAIPHDGYIPIETIQKYSTELKTAEEIMNLGDGSAFFIFNPSGIITAGSDKAVAAERLNEGATVLTHKDKTLMSPIMYTDFALEIAAIAYENGSRDVRVEVGEITDKIIVNQQANIFINDDILTITLPDGTIVSPIFEMPKHFRVFFPNYPLGTWGFSPEEAGLGELNQLNWLDKIIKAGFYKIEVYPQEWTMPS